MSLTAIIRKFAPVIAASTLFLGMFFGQLSHAKDYQIEAVLFANNQPHTAFESTQYREIAELESDAETWVIEPSMLLEEAQAIQDSENFTLLAHFSWGQEVLPSSESAIYSVTETT